MTVGFSTASLWEIRSEFRNGGATVGDKSPKSKHRGEKQKVAARAVEAALAKSKQASHSHDPSIPQKGKK